MHQERVIKQQPIQHMPPLRQVMFSLGLIRKFLKPAVFILCLLPVLMLSLNAYEDALGANPIEVITHRTGDWTLRFLLVTLAITPLRRLLGLSWLISFRRMFGLYAFFYACLHAMTWLLLDQSLIWPAMWEDILKRPYITVGATAFVLLWPLALTSTRGMQRRLGRRWKSLHRLVYPIAILGVLHFLWLIKADYAEPLIYTAVLSLLLILRITPSKGSSTRP